MNASTIHWLTQCAAEVPGVDDWLTASEAATLAGLRVDKRRSDWRLGRWTAKRAVAAHRGATSAAEPQIEIRAADTGAPRVLLDGQPAPLMISLSHSAGLALCTIAGAGVALGCDTELIEPRSRAFVADYFCDQERARLSATATAAQPCVATLTWSAKESALKALGEGLRLDTRSVVVTVPEWVPETRWRALSVRHTPSGRVFSGWWRVVQQHVLTAVAFPSPRLPVHLVANTEDPTSSSLYAGATGSAAAQRPACPPC
jgi:4'-phosphopantetheinyl transferase